MASNITLADVAKAAGVSTSTVSRIINDKPDVSSATRKHVMKVIGELGYSPHLQAQGLAAGKSRTIAILYPTENMEFSHLEIDFLIGVSNAMAEAGYLFNFLTDFLSESQLLNLYRSGQIDGTILMQVHTEDWRVNSLRQHCYPFVMIGHAADNTGISFVDLDFATAVVRCFEHLVNLGHEQIGFINFPVAMIENGYGPAVRLFEGYHRACDLFHLRPAYCEADLSLQDVFQATSKLLDEHPELTAIIGVHNALIASVIRSLQERSLSIPGDFSVVGMLTDKIARLMTPPLTAVNIPTFDMGYQASKMLIDVLRNRASPIQQVLLEPNLIVRESTAVHR